MKYAIVHKMPMELPDDTAVKIVSRIVRDKRRDVLKSKSLRLINPDTMVGLDGDDFVKARKTVRVRFDAYKVSRIIKRHLLK